MASPVPWLDALSLIQAANLVDAAHFHRVNEPFRQPQDGPWLSVEAYSNAILPIDVGANVFEERGRFVVYCIAPFGTGTDNLRILAKAVCDTFRDLGPRNPFYTSASIGFGTSSEDGSAFVLPVSIGFTYQDIST